MRYRLLGKTGYKISEVSLGTWQVGGRWGEKFDEKNALDIINRAIDLGINFIDTADVYGDLLSERAIGKALKARTGRVYVATKCGRRLKPHVSEGYNDRNIRKFVDESRKNMGMEILDLIQLHCPPTGVYYRPEVFETLETLVREGKIRHYGVSVEKVEEALKAIEYPNLASVQIIFNMFRQRPAELFFRRAREKNVGIIVRVPLASGLLTGKFGRDTKFKKDDHRFFNREGKSFDKGETFSGVDYETGLRAVEELKGVFPDLGRLAQYALKWILMFPEVSVVIPGASAVPQVESNVQAPDLPRLKKAQMKKVRDIYEQHFKNPVHHLW
jgi:aryl-alcohol dehydrogenase-like predicted oxidoreductase